MILETYNLSKSFGGLTALSDVNLKVEEGEIRGIIGPNGSGKSTLYNLISGFYKPETGSRILFEGQDITNHEPHEIARRGVGRTFQLLRLFMEMTVLENVLVGHHPHIGYGFGGALIGSSRARAEERKLKDEMMELLAFIGLGDYAGLPASELSIGQRRLLSLGRAIAMRPKLLMLDEPAAGLSPVNVENLLKTVLALKERYGLTLILIEHIMKVVMESCDVVSVLEHGEMIAEGTPDVIKDDHRVIEAYLGKEMDDAEVRAFFKSV